MKRLLVYINHSFPAKKNASGSCRWCLEREHLSSHGLRIELTGCWSQCLILIGTKTFLKMPLFWLICWYRAPNLQSFFKCFSCWPYIGFQINLMPGVTWEVSLERLSSHGYAANLTGWNSGAEQWNAQHFAGNVHIFSGECHCSTGSNWTFSTKVSPKLADICGKNWQCRLEVWLDRLRHTLVPGLPGSLWS